MITLTCCPSVHHVPTSDDLGFHKCVRPILSSLRIIIRGLLYLDYFSVHSVHLLVQLLSNITTNQRLQTMRINSLYYPPLLQHIMR